MGNRTTAGLVILVGVAVLAGGCATAGSSTDAPARVPEAGVPAAGVSAAGVPAGADSVEASASAWRAPVAASVDPVDYLHPRTGPSEPTVGTPYPYDLYVHCGGEFTRFAGRVWQTKTPPGQLLPVAEPDGSTRVTGYVAGTMELINADLARFVVDLRRTTTTSPVILFNSTTVTPPLCK